LRITERGDCGSWVIDPDDESLYGYITAGDPGTSIAYIIPAYQAFHEIEQKMGAKITFPSLESLVDRRSTWSIDGITQIANPRNGPAGPTASIFPDHASNLSNKDAARLYTERYATHARTYEDISVILKKTGRNSRLDVPGVALSPSSIEIFRPLLSKDQTLQRLHDLTRETKAQPIIPKGNSEDVAMSRENSSSNLSSNLTSNSSHSMTKLESKDGQDKVAISSKAFYQRPKYDRVYCKLCDSHQEGFRGEHELRRHVDREHKALVKTWVCEEPKDGLNHPKLIIPLSKCKACAQQKKYGAYYNAAAHLRRAHFKPKAKGRTKGNKADDLEKSGGKGGGDWPPMSELKCWMKQVEEQVAEFPVTAAEQEALDNSEDEPSLEMLGSAFDASPILNTNPSAASINDNDQSMYTASSQNRFPNLFQDSFQSDSLVLLDNTSVYPQNFADQFPGWS
jgi:hypothetical protein